MPVVTSDLLTALTTAFSALWADQFLAFSQGERVMPSIAMEVPSTTDTESYNWLGTVPKMRQWVAERQLSGLTSHNYSIQNINYESGLEIDRNTIEDDKIGIIRPRIVQLAQEAARYPDELVSNKLVSGLTDLCYDGQFFFDTDHVDVGAEFITAQSNKLTGTGTTNAQIATDYGVARAAMRNFKDGQGRPMNITPTHVMCPPALETQFLQLLNSSYYASTSVAAATENVWKGSAKLMVNPLLSDANDWYLLALDQPVKPLIFQTRRAPEFAALDSPTSEPVFRRRMFQYGVDARFGVGYGLWQMAVVTTN